MLRVFSLPIILALPQPQPMEVSRTHLGTKGALQVSQHLRPYTQLVQTIFAGASPSRLRGPQKMRLLHHHSGPGLEACRLYR